MVAKIANIILRGLEWIWVTLVMSLIGNVLALANGGNPSEINYDMFCAAFAMFTLFYLTLAAFSEGFAGIAALPFALDLLNTIFLFCAGCVMATRLRGHSCGNQNFLHGNHLIRGADNLSKRCSELQASTAFIWFAFACFLGSSIITGMNAFGGRANLRGGIRKGGPAMSQV